MRSQKESSFDGFRTFILAIERHTAPFCISNETLMFDEGVTSNHLVEATWAVTGEHAAPVLHDDELDLERKRQLSPEVHP
jgi:hypothetical protein